MARRKKAGEISGDAIHDLSGPLVLTVRGLDPRPKQSVRWVRGRPVSVLATNPKARAWARAVFNAAAALRLEVGGSIACPVILSVRFAWATLDRSRWGAPRVGRSDLDNLVKLLGDELVRAGLLVDDRLIVRASVRKEWAAPADAGATVILGPVAVCHAAGTEKPPAWLAGGC